MMLECSRTNVSTNFVSRLSKCTTHRQISHNLEMKFCVLLTCFPIHEIYVIVYEIITYEYVILKINDKLPNYNIVNNIKIPLTQTDIILDTCN